MRFLIIGIDFLIKLFLFLNAIQKCIFFVISTPSQRYNWRDKTNIQQKNTIIEYSWIQTEWYGRGLSKEITQWTSSVYWIFKSFTNDIRQAIRWINWHFHWENPTKSMPSGTCSGLHWYWYMQFFEVLDERLNDQQTDWIIKLTFGWFHPWMTTPNIQRGKHCAHNAQISTLL